MNGQALSGSPYHKAAPGSFGGQACDKEANRWLERVKQYSEEINKLAEQLSTMKGVLGQAEKLVLHNANLTRTMAQIGQTVRDVFALKR